MARRSRSFPERRAGRRAVTGCPRRAGSQRSPRDDHLDGWVLWQKLDVVRLNCGLHDLKRAKKDGHHQIEVDRYADNLRRIVGHIREGTDAALVFADTTSVLDDRHARRGADFDRTEADVGQYNAAAVAVMTGLGVPVHDLNWVSQLARSEHAELGTATRAYVTRPTIAVGLVRAGLWP